MAKTKRKNPQDLNLTNLHAMKKRVVALETSVKRLKSGLAMIALLGKAHEADMQVLREAVERSVKL